MSYVFGHWRNGKFVRGHWRNTSSIGKSRKTLSRLEIILVVIGLTVVAIATLIQKAIDWFKSVDISPILIITSVGLLLLGMAWYIKRGHDTVYVRLRERLRAGNHASRFKNR